MVGSQSDFLCHFEAMAEPFKSLLMLKRSLVRVTFYRVVDMSSFWPNNGHVRLLLFFLFNKKKNASESSRKLAETYDDNVPTQDHVLTPKTTINNDRKIGSLFKEGTAVHSIGSEGHRVQ